MEPIPNEIPHGPFRPAATGPDGMPTGRRELNIALRLLVKAKPRASVGFLPRDLVCEAYDTPGARSAAWAVMLGLRDSGRVVEFEGMANFVPNPRRVDGAGSENYAASIRMVSERVARTPEGRRRAAAVFARMRDVYGAHIRPVPGGSCLVIPVRISFRDGMPECSGAMVVHRHARGIDLLEAGAEAFAGSAPDPEGVRTPDPEACRPWPDEDLRRALMDSCISPFTSHGTLFPMFADREARGALKSVRRLRQEFSGVIDEPVDDRAWRSFMASLLRAGGIAKLVRGRGFANLDPETRKAAMRDPLATFGHYAWMCGTDDVSGLRRRQASAVVPVLVRHLREIGHVIDDGLPLMKALSDVTGLPVRVLRGMAGLTWQKLGSRYDSVAGARRGSSVMTVLATTPPHLLPRKRAEWNMLVSAAESLSYSLGSVVPPALALAAAQDRDAFARAVDAGALFAASSAAGHIAQAAFGVWDARLPNHGRSEAATRVLVSKLVGRNGGIKRLLAFNTAWHRHQPWINANINNIGRRLTGGEPVSWPPLARASFDCPFGQLVFLCDDDALALEGRTMRHCVGSYVFTCLRGDTHIASILARDGSRSTVELAVTGEGRVVVRQHRTYDNDMASPECGEVLAAFLKAANARRRGNFLNLAAVTRNRKKMRGNAASDAVACEIPDEDADAILRLFDPCLGNAVRGMDRNTWREAIEAETAAEPAPPQARVDAPEMMEAA